MSETEIDLSLCEGIYQVKSVNRSDSAARALAFSSVISSIDISLDHPPHHVSPALSSHLCPILPQECPPKYLFGWLVFPFKGIQSLLISWKLPCATLDWHIVNWLQVSPSAIKGALLGKGLEFLMPQFIFLVFHIKMWLANLSQSPFFYLLNQ